MKASLSLREAAGHLICQVNIAINDLSVDMEAMERLQDSGAIDTFFRK